MVQKLFVLAGMPASGKTNLGQRKTPPPNWPLSEWWNKSVMACKLPISDAPESLAIEIDFSHIGQGLQPSLDAVNGNPLRNPKIAKLEPRSTTVFTFWAEPATLLARLEGRSESHKHEMELRRIYGDPQLFWRYYAVWKQCVDQFPSYEHWGIDTEAWQFFDMRSPPPFFSCD